MKNSPYHFSLKSISTTTTSSSNIQEKPRKAAPSSSSTPLPPPLPGFRPITALHSVGGHFEKNVVCLCNLYLFWFFFLHFCFPLIKNLRKDYLFLSIRAKATGIPPLFLINILDFCCLVPFFFPPVLRNQKTIPKQEDSQKLLLRL